MTGGHLRREQTDVIYICGGGRKEPTVKLDDHDQTGVSAKPGVGGNKLKMLGNSLGN